MFNASAANRINRIAVAHYHDVLLSYTALQTLATVLLGRYCYRRSSVVCLCVCVSVCLSRL